MTDLTPEPAPNIVLTGFMGTGKTAVGREVAARLGRSFIDMDELIVQRTGLSIPELFERYGETHFRLLEADLLRHLAAQRGLVIATGGGALVDSTNREIITRTSLVICLAASISAIEDRVGADPNRPLLKGTNGRQRILELLEARAAAYAEIPYRIDTTRLSVAEVAAQVIALAESGLGGTLRLPVTLPDGNGYDILVGRGLLKDLPELLQERGLSGAVAIISDSNVTPHWAAPLRQALEAAEYPYTLLTLPAGEAHKTLDTIMRIYDHLLAAGLDRGAMIVALGGGVIGDMAGFAAATYLRGVCFIQVPTSLLAMVDASVGGKTGVDLPQGKNLVGAFKHPELVVIDPDLLATLPAPEFRNGLAEVIKHSIIADPVLFQQLEGDGPESLESMLARALRVKISIVERDPYEASERAYLNLGHTFAHAIEQVSNYTIPHGEAVALGLVASAHLAAAGGHCSPDLAARIQAVVERMGLPTRTSGLDPNAVLAAMRTDKKRRAGRLRFVLPHDLGHVALHDDITPQQVQIALTHILS